jgi:hypothetical protein
MRFWQGNLFAVSAETSLPTMGQTRADVGQLRNVASSDGTVVMRLINGTGCPAF